MKWAIALLVVFGIAAAAAAAILLSTWRLGSNQKEKESVYVEVVKVKTALPSSTQIKAEHIETERVARQSVPEGGALSAAQVIGKILAVPVVEGQVLTSSLFVTDGTGAQLVASIPEGMRAVSVTLSSRSCPDAFLLYPGCIVDVLVSFKLPSSSVGSALSTTMFTGVQVIAVQGESVVTKKTVEGEAAAKVKNTSGSVVVTLLVDTDQAQALQLAVNDGNIMLSLRNPLDKLEVDPEATVLSQGRMAGVAEMLTPRVISKVDQEKAADLIREALDPNNKSIDPNASIQVAEEQSSSILSRIQQAILNQLNNQQGNQNNTTNEINVSGGNSNNSNSQNLSNENYYRGQQDNFQKSPKWGVTVIRGSQTTLQELDIQQ